MGIRSTINVLRGGGAEREPLDAQIVCVPIKISLCEVEGDGGGRLMNKMFEKLFYEL